jgi:hypothetical protein
MAHVQAESCDHDGNHAGSHTSCPTALELNAALAAAEAAPLDVERLVDAMREHGIGMNRAYRIAREYAALRPPDTETAGEAG